MNDLRIFAIGLAVILFGLPLKAHEFWISPETYVISESNRIEAHLRVGQEFKGPSYSFQTRQFDRFEIVSGEKTIPVEGRLGDVPALSMPTADDGLLILVHETVDNQLTYREWEKFVSFAEHKDFTEVLDDHRARGLPETDFVELYRRYAKSLVAVGSGEGADQRVGLKTEIVAGANPYTGAITALPVEVFLDDAPRADVQIELFDRAPDGSVTITLHRTDENGSASIPVSPGHEYLVDAVAMEALPNDDPEAGGVWRSLWASLTFKVPERPLK
ncbi:MAG: DUF4198 domain-containing protein [Litoreibacter sp.]|nr:DUF4198 domain-containing protein [Litoreibacter sp.]